MPTPTRPTALRTGDLVADRYRVGRLLGSGGMADVWEATDERLHRTVALKVLRQEGSSAEDQELARQRFEAEGRLAARQIHRNIVTVFDAGTDGPLAYLVLERLDGETLRDRLGRGPLGDDEARSALADVLAALDTAHQQGIVHRDIKPGNVLRGDDGQWKVADFGIAKMVDGGLTSDLTLTGQVIGTLRYLAPERLAGRPATPAADIFAAGVLLHEAIGDRADVDPNLRAVAERAMSVDPAKRFRSARSMSEALVAPADVPTHALLVASPGDLETSSITGDEPTLPASGGGPPTVVAEAPPTQHLPTARAPKRGRARLAALAAVLLIGVLAAAAWPREEGPDAGPDRASTTSSATVPPTTTSTAPTTTAVTTTTAVMTPAPAPSTDPKGKADGKPKGKPKGKGK